MAQATVIPPYTPDWVKPNYPIQIPTITAPGFTAPIVGVVTAGSTLADEITNLGNAAGVLTGSFSGITSSLDALLIRAIPGTIQSGFTPPTIPSSISYDSFTPSGPGIPITFNPISGMDICSIALSIPSIVSAILIAIGTAIKTFITKLYEWMGTQIIKFVEGITTIEGYINRWWKTMTENINKFIAKIRKFIFDENKGDDKVEMLDQIMKVIMPYIEEICDAVEVADNAVRALISTFKTAADNIEKAITTLGKSIEATMKGLKCLNKANKAVIV
jgi:hypothetical protein